MWQPSLLVNSLPVIFAKETGVPFSHQNEHNNFGREYIPLDRADVRNLPRK